MFVCNVFSQQFQKVTKMRRRHFLFLTSLAGLMATQTLSFSSTAKYHSIDVINRIDLQIYAKPIRYCSVTDGYKCSRFIEDVSSLLSKDGCPIRVNRAKVLNDGSLLVEFTKYTISETQIDFIKVLKDWSVVEYTWEPNDMYPDFGRCIEKKKRITKKDYLI